MMPVTLDDVKVADEADAEPQEEFKVANKASESLEDFKAASEPLEDVKAADEAGKSLKSCQSRR